MKAAGSDASRWARGMVLASAALLWLGDLAGDEGAQPKAPAPMGALVGRVLVRGTPAAGTVEVRKRTETGQWAMEGGPALATVKTDAQGAFRVPDLPVGFYEVRSLVPGMVPGFSNASVPDSLDVQVPVYVPGGPHRLRGRVHWADGTPFRGVVGRDPFWLVEWTFASTRGKTFASTDAEGRFELEGVTSGAVRLDAIVPGEFNGPLREVSAPAENLELVVAAASRVLRGTVVDAADGKPIAQARLSGGTWLYTSKSRSGPDGRFELRMDEDAENVEVAADGYATTRIPAAKAEDGITLRLSRGAAIVGQVKDGQGKGVPGITVISVLGTGDWMSETHVDTSDAQGRYQLKGLSVGDPVVVALGPGWVSPGLSPWSRETESMFRVRLDPAAPVTHDLRVVRSGAARVRVHDAGGHPVPFPVLGMEPDGFYYTFLDEEPLRPLRVCRGDAHGFVEFPMLIPGLQHQLTLSAQGYCSEAQFAVESTAGSVTTREIELPAPRFVRVQVIDDVTGGPSEGAVVTAWRRHKGGFWDGLANRWLTDASGEVVVGPLPGGEVAVSVNADGRQTVDQVPVAEVEKTVIHVQRARTIGGRVLGPDGIGAWPIQLSLQRASTPTMSYGSAEQNVVVISGGPFRSQSLEGTDYIVTASTKFHGRRYEGQTRASADGEDFLIRLAATPIHEVRLRVLADADGRPIPRAEVHVFALSGENRHWSREGAVRAGDYREEVGVQVEKVLVDIRRPEDEDGRALPLGAQDVGPLSPSEQTIEVRLKPERRLAGFVHDAEGKGISGVELEALAVLPTESVPEPLAGETAHALATTDADGRFTLDRLGDLDYRIRAKLALPYATPSPAALGRGDTGPIDIRVEKGLRATLHVLDPAGKPVEGAHVYLWWWAGPQQQYSHADRYQGWLLSADGAVTFEGLVTGRRYDLEITPPESRPDLGELRIDKWEPGDADLRLEAARRLTGVVQDHLGHPLPYFPLAICRAIGHTWHIVSADGEGRFSLESSTPGTVSIRMRPEGPEPVRGPESLEVSADAKGVIVKVDDSRLLRLTCRQPVESRIPIRLAPGSGLDSRSADMVGAAPTYFPELDPETAYSLYVGPSAGARCYYREGVHPGGEPLEVVLVEGIVVRGKATGLPQAIGALRMTVSRNGLHLPMELHADGSFETPPLPEGTAWTIALAGPGVEATQELKVAPGTTVELRLK